MTSSREIGDFRTRARFRGQYQQKSYPKIALFYLVSRPDEYRQTSRKTVIFNGRDTALQAQLTIFLT
jgi:hypothetical protein